jgi:hypothetical protein
VKTAGEALPAWTESPQVAIDIRIAPWDGHAFRDHFLVALQAHAECFAPATRGGRICRPRSAPAARMYALSYSSAKIITAASRRSYCVTAEACDGSSLDVSSVAVRSVGPATDDAITFLMKPSQNHNISFLITSHVPSQHECDLGCLPSSRLAPNYSLCCCACI